MLHEHDKEIECWINGCHRLIELLRFSFYLFLRKICLEIIFEKLNTTKSYHMTIGY